MGNNPINWVDPWGLIQLRRGAEGLKKLAEINGKLRGYIYFLPEWLLDMLLPVDPQAILDDSITGLICPLNIMTPNQRALKEIVDEATLGGRKLLSKDNAEIILDWADEVKYPGRRATPGDVTYPSNWKGRPGHPNEPHIHIPGIESGHIPVESGVKPR